MYTKIAIFGVISAVLVTAIYSSSAYFVSAEILTDCSGDKKTQRCSTYDTEFNDFSNWTCTKNPDGKTWKCVKAKIVTEGSIPPELSDALDVAIEESQNTTKAPKTGVLDEPGALSDDESTENGDDTKVPKGLGGLNEDDDDAPTINPGLP